MSKNTFNYTKKLTTTYPNTFLNIFQLPKFFILTKIKVVVNVKY
jgi:hypothetical protein